LVDFASARTAGTVIDSTGAPAGEVALRFWRPTFFTNASVDNRGTFAVRLIPGESYDVDAFLGVAGPWGLRHARRIHLGTVQPGEVDATLRVPEAPVLLASGALVDKRGSPLPGWVFSVDRVDDAGHASYVASVTTDADGRYRVVSWGGGRTRIGEVRGPNGETWRVARSITDATTGETRLEARSAIVGEVVVDDGGSPANAKVRLWRSGGILDRSVSVDTSGKFDFDDTEPFTEYEIGAELPGYEPIERRPVGSDSLDVRLELVAPAQRMEGRLLDSGGEPVGCAWIRFVPADGYSCVQAMTDLSGAFSTVQAREVEYGAFVLVTGDDGRFVPGPKVGRCRGGQTALVLRAPR
jgi:hypothetical protein